MPSPFPGMDPYLERPALWPDFHDRLIIYIQEALQPLLRPRYVAIGQERLFVMESRRPVYPDVGALRPDSPRPARGATAVAEADAPAVFDFVEDERRESYLEIVEPAAGFRLVTAVEVLSPDNKDTGAGRDSYLRKRRELWRGGASQVEI